MTFDSSLTKELEILNKHLCEILDLWEVKLKSIPRESGVVGEHFFVKEYERTGSVGRPKIIIDAQVVKLFREYDYSWKSIGEKLGVSRWTLRRKLTEFGDGLEFPSKYADISDDDLTSQIQRIKSTFPRSGEKMVIGILKAGGICVQRQRVRDIIHKIDPINTSLRWFEAHPRYKYSVPAANSLWHIDANMKLRHWGIVIHACIDGYSRLIPYLRCSDNALATTVLGMFIEATKIYSIPSRVRADYGTENFGVQKFMNEKRGLNRGSFIAGSSVFNQRVERLHRDTTRLVSSSFIDTFHAMEEAGILDREDPFHIYCLHYIFIPRIQRSLDEFRNGWNFHGLSTELNKTPNQLWIDSIYNPENAQHKSARDFLNPNEIDDFGIFFDPETETDVEDEEELFENWPTAPDNLLTDDQFSRLRLEVDPFSESINFGIDLYVKCLEKIYTITMQ